MQNGIHYFHVACHGDNNGIFGTNGDHIPSTKISQLLKKLDKQQGKIGGIFFASCYFGSDTQLKTLLQAGSKITWIAGYSKKAQEINVSIFDIFFWSEFLNTSGSDLERINLTKDRLEKAMPGLIEELGFRLYCWDGRTNCQSVKLI